MHWVVSRRAGPSMPFMCCRPWRVLQQHLPTLCWWQWPVPRKQRWAGRLASDLQCWCLGPSVRFWKTWWLVGWSLHSCLQGRELPLSRGVESERRPNTDNRWGSLSAGSVLRNVGACEKNEHKWMRMSEWEKSEEGEKFSLWSILEILVITFQNNFKARELVSFSGSATN